MPVAQLLRGPRRADAGRGLAAAARSAHLGTTMPGFPNLFLLLGPNTGLGHTSMVYMIESQVAYVMDALRDMDATRRRTVRGARGGGGRASTPTIDGSMRGHGLEHRLRELVPRRHGPQRDAVARLDVALPAAHRRASTPRTSSSPTHGRQRRVGDRLSDRRSCHLSRRRAGGRASGSRGDGSGLSRCRRDRLARPVPPDTRGVRQRHARVRTARACRRGCRGRAPARQAGVLRRDAVLRPAPGPLHRRDGDRRVR